MPESETEIAEMYERIAGDEATLQRHWNRVMDDSNTCGSRSGGIDVCKQHKGDRLGPPFHEVAIFFKQKHRIHEVARWPLEDAPDDPLPAVRRQLKQTTTQESEDGN